MNKTEEIVFLKTHFIHFDELLLFPFLKFFNVLYLSLKFWYIGQKKTLVHAKKFTVLFEAISFLTIYILTLLCFSI